MKHRTNSGTALKDDCRELLELRLSEFEMQEGFAEDTFRESIDFESARSFPAMPSERFFSQLEMKSY